MISETTTQAVPEPPRSQSLWYAVQAGLPARIPVAAMDGWLES